LTYAPTPQRCQNYRLTRCACRASSAAALRTRSPFAGSTP